MHWHGAVTPKRCMWQPHLPLIRDDADIEATKGRVYAGDHAHDDHYGYARGAQHDGKHVAQCGVLCGDTHALQAVFRSGRGTWAKASL